MHALCDVEEKSRVQEEGIGDRNSKVKDKSKKANVQGKWEILMFRVSNEGAYRKI